MTMQGATGMFSAAKDRLGSIVRRPFGGGIAGQIDGARGDVLFGWALRRDRPGERLMVAAEGAAGIVTALADLYRADVQGMDGSDGYCGFALPLPAGTGTEPVRVLASVARVPLRGGPWSGSRTAPALPLRKGRLLFVVEVHARSLSGWVVAPEAPFERRMLVMELAGRTLGRTRACLFRADATMQGRDGFCGFSIAFPDGGAPCLRDEASGTVLHQGRG